MFVNLTPHELNIMRSDGTWLSLPPSGEVARVVTEVKIVRQVDGVDIYVSDVKGIIGLPLPERGKHYIVSNVLLSVAKDFKSVKEHLIKNSLYAPGELIRNELGQPIGCVGLVK